MLSVLIFIFYFFAKNYAGNQRLTSYLKSAKRIIINSIKMLRINLITIIIAVVVVVVIVKSKTSRLIINFIINK